MSPYRDAHRPEPARAYRGSAGALIRLALFGGGALAGLVYLLAIAAEQRLATMVTALFLLVGALVAFVAEGLQLAKYRVVVDEHSITFHDPVGEAAMRWDDIATVQKHVGTRTEYELSSQQGAHGTIASRLLGFRDLERRLHHELGRRGWTGLAEGPTGTYRAPLPDRRSPRGVRADPVVEPDSDETVDAADRSTHTRRRERHL